MPRIRFTRFNVLALTLALAGPAVVGAALATGPTGSPGTAQVELVAKSKPTGTAKRKPPRPTSSPSSGPTTSAPAPTPAPDPSSPAPSAPSTSASTSAPASPATSTSSAPAATDAPPPAAGYFTTLPVGSWSSLPSGAECATRVHRSSWEPRPDNARPNHTMPDPQAVKAAFASRPVGLPHWDDWLLPRVDGQFTGTTDEIIQWAACKWGIADNVLRAAAEQESTWYQYEVYPSGRPVSYYGAGDFFTRRTAASDVFCKAISQYGFDYFTEYNGLCPQTFSIAGIKSWQDPAWGQMADNQNGTFPFNRNSTAFALDYYAAHLRGVYEGWVTWLGNGYQAGDLWGAVGEWYSGGWHDSEADRYTGEVQALLAAKHWLQPDWPQDKPGCSSSYGCPQGW